MTKLIAEIGWNHMGSISLAKKMILEAKKNGADYVKTQVFNVKNLKQGPWFKDGRIEIYKKSQLNFKKLKLLKNYSKKIGLRFFASVCSLDDAKMYKKINSNIVKIPSMEARNLKLIEYCNNNFKKIIVSTGTLKFNELTKLIKIIKKKKLIMFHCVSSYPCEEQFSNLRKITLLKKIHNDVGYSDHCKGIDISILSLEHEPSYIEKHFTTDNTLPGRDNKFAILPRELGRRKEIIKVKKKNKKIKKNFLKCEIEARNIYSGRWSKND